MRLMSSGLSEYNGFGLTLCDIFILYVFVLYWFCTWCIQVLRSPNFFFSGMEACGNVEVVGEDLAVL
jgi:hypothetical protein